MLIPKNTTQRRFKSLRSIFALILREMATTYGRSPGGYVWAVAEPVAAIAVLSLAFSFAFRSPSLGTNFQLYFASGYLPFAMAIELVSKTAKAIPFSRPLLAYPAVKFTDTLIARAILAILTNLLVAAAVFIGIHIIFDLQSIIDFKAIAIAFGMAIAIGVGIGTMNAYLYLAFPIWERVWAVLTRPLVLVSGVVFFYDSMPEDLKFYMWYNPLIHVVGQMRVGFYATYAPNYISIVYVFGISLITMFFGLMLLRKHYQSLIA